MLNEFLNNLDIKQWLLENILWEFIFIPVALFLFYFFWSLKISAFLIKNNRLGLGTGARKYLADRFIRIWYTRNGNLEYLENEGRYSPMPRFLYAWFYNGVADKELEKMKLISIEVNAIGNEDGKNNKIVKPIKNLRNRLVVWLTKFYLVHFMLDDKKYYEDIKK